MDGIFLLLGSNKGDKKNYLQQAVILLSSKMGIINVSSIYETAAWGKTDQPVFYNQVVEVSTDMGHDELLKFILDTEISMGRQRAEKWGQRIIDIDILYFGKHIVEQPNLSIPHPEIPNRRFTLVPLVEIAPKLVHPLLNLTQLELLKKCQDKLEVSKI